MQTVTTNIVVLMVFFTLTETETFAEIIQVRLWDYFGPIWWPGFEVYTRATSRVVRDDKSWLAWCVYCVQLFGFIELCIILCRSVLSVSDQNCVGVSHI